MLSIDNPFEFQSELSEYVVGSPEFNAIVKHPFLILDMLNNLWSNIDDSVVINEPLSKISPVFKLRKYITDRLLLVYELCVKIIYW